LLIFPGQDSGFLVWVLDGWDDLESRLAAVELDASAFSTEGKVRVKVPGVVEMAVEMGNGPQAISTRARQRGRPGPAATRSSSWT
jgi:hypothetical protein